MILPPLPPPSPYPSPPSLNLLQEPNNFLDLLSSRKSTYYINAKDFEGRIIIRPFDKKFLLNYYDQEFLEGFEVGGFFDPLFREIYVENYEDRYCLGTAIYHELAHAIQFYLSTQSAKIKSHMGWYNDFEHIQQDYLYCKWAIEFGEHYASTSPVEAAAEVFRRIAGFKVYQDWEDNEELLEDYKNFFRSQDIFEDFPFLK